jgi:hypothetical protein
MSNKKTTLLVQFGSATAALVVQGDDKIYDATICGVLGLTRGIPETPPTSMIQVTMAQAGKSTAAVMLKATCRFGTGDDEEFRVVPLLCETTKLITAKAGGANGLKGKTLAIGGVTTKEWEIINVR